ncbi:MAG TPA: hypothetical protein VN616_10610 [Puia sp.]|nr:hypothetical protein [Puia sp.]
MKRTLSVALAMSLMSGAMAQLKAKAKCPDFYVDILNGTVNGLKPSNTPNEIKDAFPCFTSAVDESNDAKCGGGIFFKDKDISFYTKRDYVEVGPKFIGRTSFPLLGTRRGSLFGKLGNPKVKEDLWDAYETQYGTLVLHYDVAGAAGKVKYFQFSTLTTDQLNLCE